MTGHAFEVGDSVMLLDGPEESRKIGMGYGLWNEPFMRKFVGCIGEVRLVTGRRRKEYIVVFPKDVDNSRSQWYCYEEWLAHAQRLSDSAELDSMFAEIGDVI